MVRRWGERGRRIALGRAIKQCPLLHPRQDRQGCLAAKNQWMPSRRWQWLHLHQFLLVWQRRRWAQIHWAEAEQHWPVVECHHHRRKELREQQWESGESAWLRGLNLPTIPNEACRASTVTECYRANAALAKTEASVQYATVPCGQTAGCWCQGFEF
jgi:hypothetical protein